jgi:phosphomannomutase
MSSATPEEMVLRVESWIAQDPDPTTRSELESLLQRHRDGDSEATKRLQGPFSMRLSFGTAGIRGPLGFGPQAMNRVVVAQTTAGLARHLLSRSRDPSTPLRVLVGYDARKNSAVFAQDTAEVLSGHGIDVLLTPHHVPTPIVAFGVRELRCDAAIMVTASHNPAQDNGYKVYFGGDDHGSQIVPPVDSEIEHQIRAIADSLSFDQIPRTTDRVSRTAPRLLSDYVSATVMSVESTDNETASLRVVYTPMHGVGGETFLAVMEAAGLRPPVLVDQQFRPDPLFPTVAFPNPEEEGALDLAFARARDVSADIIIAHDPDADRLAVALPDGASPTGYTALTGNQVGAILGWWCAERANKAGQHGALANSIVSSPVLGKIAAHFNLDHVESLTGFKYVSRVPHLIFGFEEALGYLVNPSIVRDKDGISAGLAILHIAQTLAKDGETLWDYLATIEAAVGGFASTQITIKTTSASGAKPLTDAVRQAAPRMIGELEVISADDLLEGVGSFPRDDILRYYVSDGSRLIVRPSGTEPKVKVYLDTSGETRGDAEVALTRLERAVRDLLNSVH